MMVPKPPVKKPDSVSGTNPLSMTNFGESLMRIIYPLPISTQGAVATIISSSFFMCHSWREHSLFGTIKHSNVSLGNITLL